MYHILCKTHSILFFPSKHSITSSLVHHISASETNSTPCKATPDSELINEDHPSCDTNILTVSAHLGAYTPIALSDIDVSLRDGPNDRHSCSVINGLTR